MKKVFGLIFGLNILSLLLLIPFMIWGDKALLFVGDGELAEFSLTANQALIAFPSAVICVFWLYRKDITTHVDFNSLVENLKLPVWVYLFAAVGMAANTIYSAMTKKELIVPTLIVTFFSSLVIITAYICMVRYDKLSKIFVISPPNITLVVISMASFIGLSIYSENFGESPVGTALRIIGGVIGVAGLCIVVFVRMSAHIDEGFLEISKVFKSNKKIKFKSVTRVEKTSPLVYTAYHNDDKLFCIPLFFTNSKKLLRLLQGDSTEV